MKLVDKLNGFLSRHLFWVLFGMGAAYVVLLMWWAGV